MNPKSILSFLLCVSFFTGLSQSIDILKLKNKLYYKERDLFIRDSIFYIICEICHDRPNYMDDEFCHSLNLTIIDASKFISGKTYDLENDTAIIV